MPPRGLAAAPPAAQPKWILLPRRKDGLLSCCHCLPCGCGTALVACTNLCCNIMPCLPPVLHCLCLLARRRANRLALPTPDALCAAGTRGTVLGAIAASACVPCAKGFYQDTAGSTQCNTCGSAPVGATMCPTVCSDGYEGDPQSVTGCTLCPPGTWRSGDMPACVMVRVVREDAPSA